MKKIITLGLLTFVYGLSASETQAQRSFKSLVKTEKKSKIIPPIKNAAFKQKPTATKSRISALNISAHDGNGLLPMDSTLILWKDNREATFDGGTITDEMLTSNHWSDWDIWEDWSTGSYQFEFIERPDIHYALGYTSSHLINCDTALSYGWEEPTNTLSAEPNGTAFAEYDNAGNVIGITRFIQDNNTWMEEEKLLFEYDNAQNLTKESFLYWDGTQWQSGEESVFEYDADGNLTAFHFYEWDYSINSMKEVEFKRFEYDQAGNWTAEICGQSYGLAWDSLRKENHYDANNIRTSETFHYTEGSSWGNSAKIEYTYDNNGNIEESIISGWDNIWYEIGKINYAYDVQNNNTELIFLDYYDGMWVNSLGYDYEYNNGNLIEITAKEWYEEDDEFFESEKLSLAYNSYDQVTECKYSILIESWLDVLKWNIYYEEYDDGTDITKVSKVIDFQLYPNPAKQEITVNAGNEKINHIHIADISGKTILSLKTNEGQSKINIPTEQLTNGMYFLHVQSKDAKAVKSFVIQK